jgi:hypothetical protein
MSSQKHLYKFTHFLCSAFFGKLNPQHCIFPSLGGPSMSTINPVLSSAALTQQSAMSNPVVRDELKLSEQSAANATQAGNSSVTLSDQAVRLNALDAQLSASQTVRDSVPPENRNSEPQQMDNGLSYAAMVQNARQYLQLNDTATPTDSATSKQSE